MRQSCFGVFPVITFGAVGLWGLLASTARADVIDFDSYPDLTPLAAQYAGQGVTFSATTSAIIGDIISAGAGYATSSPRNIGYALFDSAPSPVQGTLRIDFATPASAVSFFAIDVGNSSRDATAYDALNNILQTITIYNPSGSNPAGIGNIDPVVFTVSNIAYITFGQGAFYSPGDGAGIDDLTFTIPSPGGAVVLGAMGLGGLLTGRRRPAMVSTG